MSQPAGRPLFDVLTEDLYAHHLRERTAADAAAYLADECRKKDRANETLRALLREIVAAWSEDEHHDVPAALIQAARETLR